MTVNQPISIATQTFDATPFGDGPSLRTVRLVGLPTGPAAELEFAVLDFLIAAGRHEAEGRGGHDSAQQKAAAVETRRACTV